MKLAEFVNTMSFGILMGVRNENSSFEVMNEKYARNYFFLPRVICADGFSISIQVNKGNYCESENGTREFGTEWKSVEWGFPSEEIDPVKYNAEDESNTMGTVGGYVKMSVMEELIAEHGGIDLQKTLKEHMAKYDR